MTVPPATFILYQDNYLLRDDTIRVEFTSLDDLLAVPKIRDTLFDKDGNIKPVHRLYCEESGLGPCHDPGRTFSIYFQHLYDFHRTRGYFRPVAVVEGYPENVVTNAVNMLVPKEERIPYQEA